MSNANTNHDPSEIEKFNQLAEEWWDEKGSMQALHAINPLRMQFIQQQVDLKGKEIVDVGCGAGILTESLAKAGAHVTGIDLAQKNIEVAKQHAAKQGLSISYEYLSVEALASTHANRFDVITCMEMLEHVPDPASIVAACSRLLKPEGHLFFSTINRNLKSFLFAIVGAEYLLQLIPKGTHHYDKFIKPSELNRFARQAELVCHDLTGIHYNPLSKTYSLKAGVEVNYLTHYRPAS